MVPTNNFTFSFSAKSSATAIISLMATSVVMAYADEIGFVRIAVCTRMAMWCEGAGDMFSTVDSDNFVVQYTAQIYKLNCY